MCPECHLEFQARDSLQKFCGRACVGRSLGERRRIRTVDDPRRCRREREKAAPGLGYGARRRLLARWRRQGRSCSYCVAPATTMDHAVPLVRGGTNREGNLAPCCKSCNSSKSYLLIVEWRTGKRLSPMAGPLAWRVVVDRPCLVCDLGLTCKSYCSNVCAREANARLARDWRRAKKGLPADFRPTRKWTAAHAGEARGPGPRWLLDLSADIS